MSTNESLSITGIQPGVFWTEEPRSQRGYTLDQTVNKAIPAIFRVESGFYHWHDAACIPGFFVLANDLETKLRAFSMLLAIFPTQCDQFGLTEEIYQALGGK